MARRAGERAEVGDELRAALAARKELGTDFEPELVGSFVEKVGRAIDERIDARVRQVDAERDRSRDARSVAIWSLVLGLFLTGAAGGTAGLAGVVVVWIGIVLVNFAFALTRAPRR